MEVLLKLPAGQLSRLAEVQRKDLLKRKLADPPAPLFKEVRELIRRKCAPDSEKTIRDAFREGTVRRPRAPRHTEATGRGRARDEGGTGR